MVILKTIVGNLSANVNEITFTDATINSNSIIEVYYNSNDIYTVETWQRENTIGIVTSDHNFPVSVKVLINNVVAFEPYDDTSLVNRIDGLEDRIELDEDAINALSDRVGNAEDDIDALETAMSGKQNVLTAGDNITIENDVISASGGEVVYSTTEQVIGKWINGETIYRKVFINTGSDISCPYNTWTTLPFVVVNNLSAIINARAFDANGTFMAGSFARTGTNLDTLAFLNVRNVTVTLPTNSRVIFEYIKSV